MTCQGRHPLILEIRQARGEPTSFEVAVELAVGQARFSSNDCVGTGAEYIVEPTAEGKSAFVE